MGLRDDAAVFTREILEDVDGGFGQLITLTDPHGNEVELKGFTSDIAQSIDPETGVMVSGRKVTATIPIAAIEEAGLELPVGVSKPQSTPWRVSFADLAGKVSAYKVRETLPDRTLGVIVCVLEHWG